MLPHIFNYVLNCDVDGVLDDALVEVPDDVLDHSKLLEQLSASVKDLMGEDVLLAVDPKVGKSFLGRVKYLGQVAEAPLLVQHLVCFRKLLSVRSWSTVGLEDLT